MILAMFSSSLYAAKDGGTGKAGSQAKDQGLGLREKSFTVENKYLIIPIKNKAKKINLEVYAGSEKIRMYSVLSCAKTNLRSKILNSTDYFRIFTH